MFAIPEKAGIRRHPTNLSLNHWIAACAAMTEESLRSIADYSGYDYPPFMPRKREVIPLIASLVAALLIHALLLPVLSYAFARSTSTRSRSAKQRTLGEADSSKPVRMAWISHEDYRQLQVPESHTKQPALQRHSQPVPKAPPWLHAAGPTIAQQPANPAKPASPPSPTKSQSRFKDAEHAKDPITTNKKASQPFAVPSLTSASPPHSASASPSARNKTNSPKPTSADRAQRESTPTQSEPTPVNHAGRVKVGPGLEVKTVSPQFSAVTRASALPRNPIARLTFNAEGQVSNVELLRSSGAENVDGPVLAALYKWQAVGKNLSDMNPPFTHTFRIVLLSQ